MKIQAPPLDSKSVLQMHQLWLTAFGESFVSDVPDAVLYGEEWDSNSTNIYRHMDDNQTIATAIVIRSLSIPSLGGLGEVSTHPKYRGKGLATGICDRVVEDFFNLIKFVGDFFNNFSSAVFIHLDEKIALKMVKKFFSKGVL